MRRRIVLCVCALCAALCFPTHAASPRGIPLTQGEERLLSAVVDGVAGTCRGLPFAGRVAICAVVLRRYDSGRYGSTLAHVIAGTGLFPYCDLSRLSVPATDSPSFQAVLAAENGADPSGGAWHIRLPSDTSHPALPGTALFSCGGITFYGGTEE